LNALAQNTRTCFNPGCNTSFNSERGQYYCSRECEIAAIAGIRASIDLYTQPSQPNTFVWYSDGDYLLSDDQTDHPAYNIFIEKTLYDRYRQAVKELRLIQDRIAQAVEEQDVIC
jgi:hypothetical protein